jgi:transposase InsO family protein
VDSVHQGDLDKQKGVYHINLVDEVTQMEYIGCVEKISEHHMLPMLEELLTSFPYHIIGFHSDNGSEYINRQVAGMLSKMCIEQTKSRSRQTNDNSLAEGKNGSLIRKYAGYMHIPQKHAARINFFYTKYLNPYINFHRYCGFATEYINEKGKIKKKYDTYMTPIQKLLSLPECEKYLKEGVSIESLKHEERRMTHFESAQEVFRERQKMFREINRKA